MAPHVYGQSMAGAGGGGFMYVVAKEAGAASMLEETVRSAVSSALAKNETPVESSETKKGRSSKNLFALG